MGSTFLANGERMGNGACIFGFSIEFYTRGSVGRCWALWEPNGINNEAEKGGFLEEFWTFLPNEERTRKEADMG